MRAGRGAVVAGALALDALLGEPPESLHPTVWMGRAISAFEKRAIATKSRAGRRLKGVALAFTLPAASFALTRFVERSSPCGLRPSLAVVLISATISARGLAHAARGVADALESGDLAGSRALVGEFVGRDTAGLRESEVARAAVESVAENVSDGVIAPMLYGLFFGAPGALAYKAVNTLDSMVGHRAPRYAELGWASAHLDDLANLIPARLTVLAVTAVSGQPARTLSAALRHGSLTDSPNAGRVEASFAGALGLKLGGANSYGGVIRKGPILGDGLSPEAPDIRQAVRLMRRCCALIASLMLLDGLRRG